VYLSVFMCVQTDDECLSKWELYYRMDVRKITQRDVEVAVITYVSVPESHEVLFYWDYF
jgi:hypothetical protein